MKVLLLALFVAAVAAVPLPEDASDAVQMIVNGVPEGQALEVEHILDIKLKEHTDGQLVAASNLLHPYTAVGIAEAAAADLNVLPAPAVPEVVPEAVVLPAPAAPEVVPSPVVLPAPAAPEVIPAPVVLPAPAAPEVVPEPVVLPSPVAPEVIPEPVVLPAPVAPEVIPEPVVLPAPVAPEVIPEPVVLPAPVAPEVAPEPVVLPSPVAPEVVIDTEDLPIPAPQVPNGEVYNDGLVEVSINGPDEGAFSTLQSWLNMVINYFNNGAVSSQNII